MTFTTDNMKTKHLKQNPIIPPALYATRAADRQIRRIIDEMGRPGYVLVARQMGKTNLLLNAKRELEGDDDCFLYLDVSNLFPNIAGFFRNITDTALDTYPEKLQNVASIIRQRRLTPSLPHKEHELELRDLLRAVKGKVIICLDEIDALTKTDYSDQVFSFLRSIYFSGRINFPEFNRLTYILSGVAEPSALIKNKDVSPFNIGEKIYLEDFTSTEFSSFLNKAKLGFSPEVGERIFYWMHGNPRMSWDICSKLEDLQNEGVQLNETLVDETVKTLYLTNFDVPPIDHLRTLAEDDKEIRQALMSLHYGKAATISDALKSKLYLHGFVQPGSKDESIRIKNLVIEDALSESWLQDVEQRKTTLIERADKKFQERSFKEALVLYGEFLATANIKSNLSSLYYQMGRCCLEAGQYSEAIEYFIKVQCDRNELPKMFLSTHYYIGVCNRNLNRIAEAIENLNVVINEGKKANIRTYHFDAWISMSSINISIRDYPKVIEITELIISSEADVRQSAADDRHANEILFAAHFNASIAMEKLANINGAKEHLQAALELSDIRTRSGVLLRLAQVESAKTDKLNYIAACVQHITENRLPIVYSHIEMPLALHAENILLMLTQLRELEDSSNLERLLAHVFAEDVPHYASLYDIVCTLVFRASTKPERDASLVLVDRALQIERLNQEEHKRRNLLTFSLLLRPFESIENVESKYLEEFWSGDSSSLIESDYRLTYGLVRGYLDIGAHDKARAILNRVHELVSAEGSFVSEGCTLLIDYLDVLCKIHVGFVEAALPPAKELEDRISKNNRVQPPLYFPESIFDDAKAILSHWIKQVQGVQQVRRAGRKIGRNDRVTVRLKNGSTIVDKYKRLESIILAGEGELLETNSLG